MGWYCGSGLACDAGGAVCVSRTIAGQPASTLTVQILWVLACQRLGRLPQVLRCSQNQDLAGLIMWERACSRWHHFGSPDRPQRLHRWQASSHKARANLGYLYPKPSQASQPHKNCVARKFDACRDYCGSGLARDAGGAVWQANRGDAIAGKPAPAGFTAPTESGPYRVRPTIDSVIKLPAA